MSSNWPLAFLEFFVVIAFGVAYLVADRIAKRAAVKYADRDATPGDAGSDRRDAAHPGSS